MAININERFCKGCGICLALCPRRVLALSDKGKVYVKDLANCSGCGQCELRCPDFAIKLVKAVKGDSDGEGAASTR